MRCNHWLDRTNWQQQQHKGRTRVMCAACGGFVGYIRDEPKRKHKKPTEDLLLILKGETPVKFPPQSETKFELPPAGNLVGRCHQIIDLGTQPTNFGDKRQVQFAWELPTELMDDGRPFSIRSQRMTLSGNEKATLRLMLESWRGKAFTSQELNEFDIASVIGATCLLNIVHETKEGTDKTFANIKSVTPLPNGTTVPPAINQPVHLDLDEFRQSDFEAIGEYQQSVVAESPEYQGIRDAR